MSTTAHCTKTYPRTFKTISVKTCDASSMARTLMQVAEERMKEPNNELRKKGYSV